MPDSFGTPRRHDLVRLAPQAAKDTRTRALGCLADSKARELLARWLGRGHPLIVTRQPEAGEGLLSLGLALPPRLGRHRLPFLVPACHVLHLAPPPRLETVAPVLPESWQALLSALRQNPALRAVNPRVLGSAGMQAITGEPCLGEGSDLDLLLEAPDWRTAEAALLALKIITEATSGPRVDGELRSPDGFDAAWREAVSAPRRILVKELRSVALEPLAVFRARFAGSPAFLEKLAA